MVAEFWSTSLDSDSPVAHWMRFAEFVSARDHHSLDDDVKMFFALSNALMDADIAAWDAKRYYDSVRPATAIPLLFRGKTIKTWGGPGKGIVQVDGGQWLPYQSAALPTPSVRNTSLRRAQRVLLRRECLRCSLALIGSNTP